MDTIRKGISEIKTKSNLKESGRLRKEGGGRKKITDKNPHIKKYLKELCGF